jgi:hypothetical protein
MDDKKYPDLVEHKISQWLLVHIQGINRRYGVYFHNQG